MKPSIPPATAIATATSLVGLTKQPAAQAKKVQKQAKARYKAAKKALKQARRAARKAAKLAGKARRRFDELQRQVLKRKQVAPVRKSKVKPKMRPAPKPANPGEPIIDVS